MDVTSLFQTLIQDVVSVQESQWLESKIATGPKGLPGAFVAVPRFIPRRPISLDAGKLQQLAELIPDWHIADWSIDRLCRVYLLLNIPSDDEASYIKAIENLFDTAELHELAALYSALPALAFPEHWLFRATEAVRSNMGPVFDAIAFGNPYPAAHFSEAAWNQLVLKCIFNAKPIHLIVGLDQRANRQLAQDLSDLAHERWAAGRQIPAQAWRLMSPFMDEVFFNDLKTLFGSSVVQNQQAAALVSTETPFQPAQTLLAQHAEWEQAIQGGTLAWADLED